MIAQLPQGESQVVVLFRLPTAIWADSICVVGDFNQWNTSATPMRQGEQYWEANLTLEAGKTYYFAYLVDGKDWCTEPAVAMGATGSDLPSINLLPIGIAQPRQNVVGG